MSLAVELATAGATGWIAVHTAICGVAMARALRPRPRPQPSTAANVLLVRPCTGDDPHLVAALRSTGALETRGTLRIVFTVESRSDAAWPIIEGVAEELRDAGADATATVTPTQAYNRKVGQLAAATNETDADVVLCVDADVDLSGFDLDAFIAPLSDASGLGAVWAPPVEVAAPQTWGDRASAAVLGASLHAFTLLGELDEAGLVGKTFALRTDALRSTGGFVQLTRHLGEDMELARRLRIHGWGSRMHRTPVRSIAAHRPLRGVLARYTRWLWVIRAQRPALLASYPLLLAATPLLLMVTAALSAFAPTWGLALAAVVLGTRIAVAFTAARPRGRRLQAVTLDWALSDAVLLLAFIRALGKPEVSWRSKTLRIDRDGRLTATP